MTPTFPHTHVKSVAFSNYSGTIQRAVPIHCTPEGGTDPSVLRVHGDALRAIVAHCFAQNPPSTLRALGSTWSFSRIIEPGEVALDTANFTFIERIPSDFFTPPYQARAARGFAPMFIEGGTQIAGINRRLGKDVRLALQTSGSGDGHRIAGCLATGTHGSALRIGAVHDTVLGFYLVVAPDRAVFVQSLSSQFCTDQVAPWLQQQSGIPTRNLADDDLFHAALVSLGSFGVAFGVVVEMAPLYRLKFKSVPRPRDDQEVWHAIRTLDTSRLHPEVAEAPDHFDVVMHPYPPGGSAPGLVATMMWKTSAANVPSASPLPAIPRASSDLMGFIAQLTDALGNRLTAPLALPILRDLISQQLGLHASTGEVFPGQMFGPTTLPPGTGASTEIVVRHADAERALGVVDRILRQKEAQGDFLLGAIGVRFVPQTQALLGMNIFPMNTYIELPSIRSNAVLGIYRAVWDALEHDGIVFTCHWGQLHGITPARLARYFGPRVDTWKAARARLLGPVGSRVFAAPILAEVGLT
jgi:hypothetical protein